MLVDLIVLAALAAPQEPVATTVRETLDSAEVAAPVNDLRKRLKSVRQPQLKSVAMPDVIRRLRLAGPDLIEEVDSWTQPPEGDPGDVQRVTWLFEQARKAWGFRGRPARVPRNVDIPDVISAAEKAFRDTTSTLGSGRRLTDVAAWMLSTIDTLRSERDNLGELTREDQKELTERFERVGSVDQKALLEQAELLTRMACALSRPEVLAKWERESARNPRRDGAVQGDVLMERDTGFGRVVVGGFGRNVYDTTQVAVIIDLGGDDEYNGPAGGANDRREMAMVVDLQGDDTYNAVSEGLGSAVFGIGILVDCKGDDTYNGELRCAGFGAAGVGVFADLDGDDTYALGAQSGGAALAGTGIFYDAAGNDVQEAGAQSFGVGLPGGVGIAWDGAGDDQRKIGIERRRVVDASTTGTDSGAGQAISVGFGVGIGALPFLAGGVGTFFDSEGADRYEAGGLAFGVGARGGLGMFLEGAGDDVYVAEDGAFGVGYGFGVGVCLDQGGADSYTGKRLVFGGAEYDGLGVFSDRTGVDSYTATWPALGVGRRGGFGLFVERGGADHYTLAASPAEWRLDVGGDSRGVGVGLLLDIGDLDDELNFTGIAEPVRGELRVDERGEGDGVEKQVILFR